MGLHLDRRAADLAEKAAEAPADALLTTDELAAWLGVCALSVKRWRYAGVGPRFIWVSARSLRYRKSDVVAWLEERAKASAA
jgi:hypothetical protein